MVSDPFLVGVFYGLVPAFGLLYVLLHRYEGLFSERKAFFAFFLGMAAGLVATLLQRFIGPPAGSPWTTLALFAALFGLSNALLITMGLNSRRFRVQRDTPLYGVAYGLGFGGLQVLFWIGATVNVLAATPTSLTLEILQLTLFGLYFVAGILVHASVGAYIGRGTATRRVGPELLRGTLLEGVYVGGFYVLLRWPSADVLPPFALALALLLLARTIRNVLDQLVPAEVLREIQLHRRRLGRKIRRDATSTGSDPAEARTDDSPDAGPRAPETAPPPP